MQERAGTNKVRTHFYKFTTTFLQSFGIDFSISMKNIVVDFISVQSEATYETHWSSTYYVKHLLNTYNFTQVFSTEAMTADIDTSYLGHGNASHEVDDVNEERHLFKQTNGDFDYESRNKKEEMIGNAENGIFRKDL